MCLERTPAWLLAEPEMRAHSRTCSRAAPSCISSCPAAVPASPREPRLGGSGRRSPPRPLDSHGGVALVPDGTGVGRRVSLLPPPSKGGRNHERPASETGFRACSRGMYLAGVPQRGRHPHGYRPFCSPKVRGQARLAHSEPGRGRGSRGPDEESPPPSAGDAMPRRPATVAHAREPPRGRLRPACPVATLRTA